MPFPAVAVKGICYACRQFPYSDVFRSILS